MKKIKTCTKQPNNRNNEVERTHLSLTKFLQLLNLAIFAISLQPPRSTSSSVVTLSRPQPSPPWKSQIAHLDTSSLESTSRFIPSASQFSSRFTSSSASQLISVIIPTLVIHHSFTLSLQAQNLPFQQILSTVDRFLLPTGLPHDNGTGPDLSRSSFYF